MKLLKTILQDYMPIVVPVIGCMELHDLQVEKYIGTCRGSHNSFRLLEGLKPRGPETHPYSSTRVGVCMDPAMGK